MKKNKTSQASLVTSSANIQFFLIAAVALILILWTGAGVYQLITTGQTSILLAVMNNSIQIATILGKFLGKF